MYQQETCTSNTDAVPTLTFMSETPTLRDRIAAGILDTAAAVLAGRGESASMAEIADAAGVSRATLYRYFPSRDALLRGLAEAASAELRERIADAELETIPVPEAIARLTRGFVFAGSKYVALTRAYLTPARVVILDEATCHLDPAAEEQAEAVFSRRGGTLIVIAHRISSARRARRILVLDGNRPQLGNHSSLLASSALYADLAGQWDVPSLMRKAR